MNGNVLNLKSVQNSVNIEYGLCFLPQPTILQDDSTEHCFKTTFTHLSLPFNFMKLKSASFTAL